MSGSTPVRQFNIRPSCMKRRCISLLRLAPPCRFACLLACVAASPPHKKIRGWGQRSSSSGVPGKTRLCLRRALYAPSAMRPTAQHQHASSPAIATLAALDWLPAARIGRDGLAFGRLLQRARRAFVMPRGLDQQLPQVDLLHYLGQIYEGLRNTERKVPTWQTPGIRGSSRRGSSGR